MSIRKRRAARGPWKVSYKQFSEKGSRSRPQIVDADGERVNLNQNANAECAAMAPGLLGVLEELEPDIELWWRMLRSEHPGIIEPAWLAKVQAYLRFARVNQII